MSPTTVEQSPSNQKKTEQVRSTGEKTLWLYAPFALFKMATVRGLVFPILLISLYSYALVYIDRNVYDFAEKSAPVIHSLLGFVISAILVFRTNTAYERWWEARKLWGQLVNTSRALAMKLSAYLPVNDRKRRRDFRILIGNFPAVLKNHLRQEGHSGFEGDGDTFFDLVQSSPHRPNCIASLLFSHIIGIKREGFLSEQELLTVYGDVNILVDIVGACERIKNTPPPASYVFFMHKIILLYVLFLPISLLGEFGYTTVFISSIVFYVLAALEGFALEIEDPFGYDSNDLPLDSLVTTIRKNVEEVLPL